jgi:hypothetical protein
VLAALSPALSPAVASVLAGGELVVELPHAIREAATSMLAKVFHVISHPFTLR